jgi:hypothetical protein
MKSHLINLIKWNKIYQLLMEIKERSNKEIKIINLKKVNHKGYSKTKKDSTQRTRDI